MRNSYNGLETLDMFTEIVYKYYGHLGFSKSIFCNQRRIQKLTAWRVFSRPEVPNGEGTGGVSSRVGVGSRASPKIF